MKDTHGLHTDAILRTLPAGGAVHIPLRCLTILSYITEKYLLTTQIADLSKCYKCTLQTDTEVITYIMDYLLRVQGLTLDEAASVIAAPFWSTIDGKTDLENQKKLTYLRTMFPSLLVTGPFSIVLGFDGGLMALNDRLKLRSMVVGEKDDKVFIASEEAAIRTMEPNAENIWSPAGGEPVIVKVKEGAY